MNAAKMFFLIAFMGVVLNALGCMVISSKSLWWGGVVIFLLGAIGVFINTRVQKKENK